MSIIKQTHRDALKEIYGSHYLQYLEAHLIEISVLNNAKKPYTKQTISKVCNNQMTNTRVAVAIIFHIQEKRQELLRAS